MTRTLATGTDPDVVAATDQPPRGTAALSISQKDVERLWSRAVEAFDVETLRSLNANTAKPLAFEAYAVDDCLTLRLGSRRLRHEHRAWPRAQAIRDAGSGGGSSRR